MMPLFQSARLHHESVPLAQRSQRRLFMLLLYCYIALPCRLNAQTQNDPTSSLETLLKNVGGQGPHLMARIITTQGQITCRLFNKRAPLTTAVFVGLATGQRKYLDVRTGQWTQRRLYDGSIFHRVVPDYMIQAGCPEGSGFGGPGFLFEMNFIPH